MAGARADRPVPPAPDGPEERELLERFVAGPSAPIAGDGPDDRDPGERLDTAVREMVSNAAVGSHAPSEDSVP
jgi:hypothetical protein